MKLSDRPVFVLGAKDPEMYLIERLLQAVCPDSVMYAQKEGRRVNSSRAYQADGVSRPERLASADTVYQVECALSPELVTGKTVLALDHHYPQDFGYEGAAADFLRASTLGQVLLALAEDYVADLGAHCRERWQLVPEPACEGRAESLRFAGGVWQLLVDGSWYVIPRELVLIAAGDHCLAAAYAGECPGVDPDELWELRITMRAEYRKVPREQILAEIEKARQILREAPRIAGIADLRKSFIPGLLDVACRDRQPFLSEIYGRNHRETSRRVVLRAADAQTIERFLRGEIVPHLTDFFGGPARGFVGGFVKRGKVAGSVR